MRSEKGETVLQTARWHKKVVGGRAGAPDGKVVIPLQPMKQHWKQLSLLHPWLTPHCCRWTEEKTCSGGINLCWSRPKVLRARKAKRICYPEPPPTPSLLFHSEGEGREFSNKGINMNLGKNVCVGEGDLYFFGFVSLF